MGRGGREVKASGGQIRQNGPGPEAGDLDSDANSAYTGEKGKVKEGSKGGPLGYTNISGRERGGQAGKDDVSGAREASTPASRKGEEATEHSQGCVQIKGGGRGGRYEPPKRSKFI